MVAKDAMAPVNNETLDPLHLLCDEAPIVSVSDLLCNEETLLDPISVDGNITSNEAARSDDITRATLDECLSPIEMIRIMSKREETHPRCKTTYLRDVQVDGMNAGWRQKMCRWMFEVRASTCSL